MGEVLDARVEGPRGRVQPAAGEQHRRVGERPPDGGGELVLLQQRLRGAELLPCRQDLGLRGERQDRRRAAELQGVAAPEHQPRVGLRLVQPAALAADPGPQRVVDAGGQELAAALCALQDAAEQPVRVVEPVAARQDGRDLEPQIHRDVVEVGIEHVGGVPVERVLGQLPHPPRRRALTQRPGRAVGGDETDQVRVAGVGLDQPAQPLRRPAPQVRHLLTGRDGRDVQERGELRVPAADLLAQFLEQGDRLVVAARCHQPGAEVEPHPGAQQGVVAQFHRPGEVVQGAGHLGPQFGPAEFDEQVRRVRGRGRLLEGAGEKGHRLADSVPGDGPAGRPAEERDDRGVPGHVGAQQVPGDVLQGGAVLVQHAGRPRMCGAPHADRQVPVDRDTHGGVDETRRNAGTHQPVVGERAQGLGRGPPVDAGDLHGVLGVGLGTEHGHGLDQCNGRGGEEAEPAQHAPHDLGRREVEHPLRREVVGLPPCQGDFAEQFAEQEGYAAGRPVAGVHQPGRGLLAQPLRDVCPDPGLAERSRPDQPGRRVGDDGARVP